MTTIGAVVVGGDYRGLGIVRSLGRRGLPVWVVHDTDTIARHSRYCRKAVRWSAHSGGPLPEQLLKLADDHGLHGWVLFATSDETSWALSRHWDELASRYRLTAPRWTEYSAAADKRHVHAVAASLGVSTPRCWFPSGLDDLGSVGITAADFPLVIKPTRRETLNALTTAKAWRVDDHAALLRRYRDALALLPAHEVMVQEWIPGGGDRQYAVGAVCSGGEPRVLVAARRRRQYPREFGRASCFVETIDDPELVKDATRLIAELRIDGLVEVEFKKDALTNELKLLDVNPRVWGWHSIGPAAGVDFSYAAYRLALGEEPVACAGAVGVRWSRLSVDLPYAAVDIVRGRMRVKDFVRSVRPPLAGPIAARDDPMPALLELPLLARTLLRHRYAKA